MYRLTIRQQDILLFLLKQTKPKTTLEIAKEFSCSERTIRYELDCIEVFLSEKKLTLNRKQKVGIILEVNKKQKESIKRTFALNQNDPVLKKDERFKTIIALFLFGEKPLTTEEIANRLMVSRQTIVSDIKELKEILKKDNVDIEARRGLGTTIVGSEKAIRDLMIKCVSREFLENNLVNNLNTDLPIKKQYLNSRQKLIMDYLIDKNAIKFIDVLNKLKDNNKLNVDNENFIKLYFGLLICIKRIKHTSKIENINVDEESYEYQLARELERLINKEFKITITKNDIKFIAILLILCDIRNNEHYVNDKVLENIVEEMLAVLNNYPELIMPKYYLDKLKKALVLHLQLTIKKYNLKLVSSNSLLASLRNNYPTVFKAVNEMAVIFEKHTSIPLSDDEQGFITIHIASNVEEYNRLTTKKTIIVCNTGTGVAKVLCNRLKNNIPRLIIKDTVAYLDLKKDTNKLSDVDFIVSTFEIKGIKIPVFVVNPIISKDEIEQINAYINGTHIVTKTKNEKASKFSKSISDSEIFSEIAFQSSMLVARFANIIIEAEKIFNLNVDSGSLCGLMIHILMSLPHWVSNENINNYASDDIKNSNKDLYEYLKFNIREIVKEYGIYIPDDEASAMMHYIL